MSSEGGVECAKCRDDAPSKSEIAGVSVRKGDGEGPEVDSAGGKDVVGEIAPKIGVPLEEEVEVGFVKRMNARGEGGEKCCECVRFRTWSNSRKPHSW